MLDKKFSNFSTFVYFLSFLCFMLGWLWKFITMLSVVSRLLTEFMALPGHLKRLDEGTIFCKKIIKKVEFFILLRIGSFF